MDLIEGIKTCWSFFGVVGKVAMDGLWEMDLIEGIKTFSQFSQDRPPYRYTLWEMDLIEGIKT